MTSYKFLTDAAIQSRGDRDHWFRYLRKVITSEVNYITSEDLKQLLASSALSDDQKTVLREAVIPGSPTNVYVLSLNEKMPSRDWSFLLKKAVV